MIPRRDTLALEVVEPDGASPAAQNPGVSWAWSTWAQMTAGLSYPLLLTHLSVSATFYYTAAVSSTFEPVQIQIGTGAAGSETGIGEIGTSFFVLLSGTTPSVYLQTSSNFPVTPTIIPANTRIAIRSTERYSAVLFALSYYLYGYNATKYSLPLYFRDLTQIEQLLKGLRTKKARITPLAGVSPYIISGAGAWVLGSWVQIIASADKDLLVTGLVHTPTTVSRWSQYQIGVGAVGSEQAMSTIGISGGTGSGVGAYYLPRPLLVKKGESVSVRSKSSGSSIYSYVNLLYNELT